MQKYEITVTNITKSSVMVLSENRDKAIEEAKSAWNDGGFGFTTEHEDETFTARYITTIPDNKDEAVNKRMDFATRIATRIADALADQGMKFSDEAVKVITIKI